MKRLLLISTLVWVAFLSCLLWQRGQIGKETSILEAQLSRLRNSNALSRPAATQSEPERNSAATSSDFSPELFIAAFTESKDIKATFSKFHNQLAAAPASQLKEIFEQLYSERVAMSSAVDYETLEILASLIAAKDPALALAVSNRIHVSDIYALVGKSGLIGKDNWNVSYVEALETWLNVKWDGKEPLSKIDDDPRFYVGWKGKPPESFPLFDRSEYDQLASLHFDIKVFHGDPTAAIKLLEFMSPDAQRRSVLDLAASLTTPQDQQRALTVAGTGMTKENLQSFTASLATNAGFAAARDMLTAVELPPENFDRAALGVASANFRKEANEKADWLLQSVRSEEPGVLGEFSKAWAHADYNAAAQWINAIPAGKKRDAAVAGFAPAAAKVDGASAVDWALTIADPARREATLEAVSSTWQKIDHDTATAYLMGKGVTINK